MTITCIKDASWVVAWDHHLRQHYFRNHIDVAFDGDRIIHVDPDYDGPVDRRIDGAEIGRAHVELQSRNDISYAVFS